MKVNRGYRSRIVEENELVTVRTKTSGILVLKVKCGDHLSVGDEIAEIIDTYEGDVIRSDQVAMRGMFVLSWIQSIDLLEYCNCKDHKGYRFYLNES